MVTCQGCGETTSLRLCCPSCTEAGRTSFFCSQDCFRASWASHSKLHAVLQRGAAATGAAAAAAGTPGAAAREDQLSDTYTDSTAASHRRDGAGSPADEPDSSS
ncbi:hypothetical protein, conserved, partial [Eimeria tenella]